MDDIIAARFQTRDGANSAASAMNQYTHDDDICIFYNSPPAQQEASLDKGNLRKDGGTAGAGKSAAIASVAAGLSAGAIGSLGGPAVALAAAGIGAYTGSLIGALNALGNADADPATPEHRNAGIILATRVDSALKEKHVIADLRAHGAEEIEQARGEWRNGDWAGFDPRSSTVKIESDSD